MLDNGADLLEWWKVYIDLVRWAKNCVDVYDVKAKESSEQDERTSGSGHSGS